jgi:hypothetical protein
LPLHAQLLILKKRRAAFNRESLNIHGQREDQAMAKLWRSVFILTVTLVAVIVLQIYLDDWVSTIPVDPQSVSASIISDGEETAGDAPAAARPDVAIREQNP